MRLQQGEAWHCRLPEIWSAAPLAGVCTSMLEFLHFGQGQRGARRAAQLPQMPGMLLCVAAQGFKPHKLASLGFRSTPVPHLGCCGWSPVIHIRLLKTLSHKDTALSGTSGRSC